MAQKKRDGVKAVLFDFWGTIVEQGTYSPLRQSYKLLSVRLHFSDYVQQFENVLMTKPYDDQTSAFQAVCEAFGIEQDQRLIDELIGLWNKNKLLAKPYPETVDVLKMLKEKGIKLALVSNSPSFSTEPILEKFKLGEYFDVLKLSYNSGKLKQDSLISEAVKELGVKPTAALMVGDSIQTDMRGAEKAGVKGVLIDRRDVRTWEEKIKDLKELEKYL